MTKTDCPKCDGPDSETAKFCQFCGSNLFLSQRSFLLRHKAWFIALFLISILVILPTLAVLSFFSTLGTKVASQEERKTIISGSGEDKIALINIDGLIVEKESSKGFGAVSEEVTSARKVKKVLREVESDKRVKAILLRINSPGGSAVASEEIYQELLNFKKRTNKKVIVYFSDFAASGGYYIAMAADQIIANPSTITGSIGVIISYLNVKDLAEKYGVKSIVYKSGAHKDIISEFRDPTEGEKEIIQSIVDDSYGNFVKAVAQGRALPEDQVKELADGRIYSAKQAKSLKLVDEIGNFEKAADAAKKLANLKEASVVEFGTSGFLENFLGQLGPRLNLSFLPQTNYYFDTKPGLKILYLYTP